MKLPVHLSPLLIAGVLLTTFPSFSPNVSPSFPEKTLAPLPPTGPMIRITEFAYSSTPGEFVELTNVGDAPADLTGWSFDDDSNQPGSFDLSGFGTVQAGESVIITEVSAAAFRTAWYLPTSVKVLGGLADNLGRADQINIYDHTNALATRLTFSDQTYTGTPRTQDASAWTTQANLGVTPINNVWRLSTVNDAQNSYQNRAGNPGNPGTYFSTIVNVRIAESGGSTAVTEGGATDTYTVRLTSQPSADVTVTATPDAQVSVNFPTLTFTSANWATPQTVTVTAVNDVVFEGAHTGLIGFSVSSSDPAYDGLTLNSLSATVTDNDAAVGAAPTLSESTASPYLNLPAAGPGFVSAVLDNPTDPARSLGIDFTLTDADIASLNNLTLTALSNNAAVVPNANLVLSGTGGSRNLKITPVGVGYATITLRVSDGPNSVAYVINYAASAASTSTSRFHVGVSDASTAQALDADFMLVTDDENQVIRLYNRQNSGLPVASFDFNSSLGISSSNPEADLESSLRVGNRIYWLGSHGNSSGGAIRPNRYRLFATDLGGSGAASTLSYVGRYDGLRNDLLAWDAANGHGLGANFLGLTASAAAGVLPEAPNGAGFNIEGLTIAPDGTTGYLAFRAPIVPASARSKALIVPVTNFTGLFSGNPTAGTATFGNPIQLDLGGRGIREIKCNASGQYLIVAGPSTAFSGSSLDFRLYTWSGNTGDAAVLRSADLSGLAGSASSLESIVDLPSTLSAASSIQFLLDNGDLIYYTDNIIAKDLPQTNFKKFRSDYATLGAAIVPGTATLSGTATICAGDSATLSVAISAGTAPFTVVYAANGSEITQTNYISGAAIRVSPPGNTTYTLVSVTDANGAALTGVDGTGTVTVIAPVFTEAVVVSGGPVCAGQRVTLTFNVNCTVNRTFQAELSDAGGSFDSPIVLGNVTPGQANFVAIPAGTGAGSGYQIRVVTTNPGVTSTSGAFQVKALLFSSTPTVSQTPACAGGSVRVSFTLSNVCPFPEGNVFRAQLSAANGSFESPLDLGVVSPGLSTVAIPQTVPTGGGYRIRIVASADPLLLRTNPSSAFTVNQPQFASTPTVSLDNRCPGEAVRLSFSVSSCSFFAGNTFRAELSDASGSFASPVALGTVNAGSLNNVVIPGGTPAGTGYRIRVVGSQPVLTSAVTAAFRVKACGNNREISLETPGLRVSVSPNPSPEGRLRIAIDHAESEPLTVELFNPAGQSIRREEIRNPEPTSVLHWDIARQPSGLYLLRVAGSQEVKLLKVLR